MHKKYTVANPQHSLCVQVYVKKEVHQLTRSKFLDTESFARIDVETRV
jgi:hypothetical protein